MMGEKACITDLTSEALTPFSLAPNAVFPTLCMALATKLHYLWSFPQVKTRQKIDLDSKGEKFSNSEIPRVETSFFKVNVLQKSLKSFNTWYSGYRQVMYY